MASCQERLLLKREQGNNMNISEKITSYEKAREFINRETLKFLKITMRDADEIIKVFKKKRQRLQELKTSIKGLEDELEILNEERTELLTLDAEMKNKLEKHQARMKDEDESVQEIQKALIKKKELLEKRESELDEREGRIDAKIRGYKIAKPKSA